MNHLRTCIAALTVIVALGVGAGHALAGPEHKPSKAQIAKAKKHFEAAQQAQAQKKFDLAAKEYQAAYDAMPDPEFIYDIGEVHRLAGHREAAIAAYKKYLADEPNGRGADAARQSIQELQTVLDAEAAAARNAKEAEAARKQAEAEAAKRKAAEEQAKRDQELTKSEPAPRRDRGHGLRIAGIITAGVGVAAVGGGVFFGLHAHSLSNQLSGGAAFDQSKYDAGKAAERNMFIAYGVGAAALVGGVTMYVLGSKHRGTEQPMVGVVPVAGGLAVTTAGRF